MIIEGLLTLIYNLFSLLTMPIDIPELPAQVYTYMDQYFGYLESGLGIVAAYTHLGYLVTLFEIVLAVEAGLLIYKIVMWVLRKIPMLNIS